LSPVGELGATTGATEFGIAVEEDGMDSWANFVGSSTAAGAAKGDAEAGGAEATAGLTGFAGLIEVARVPGSADATLTGSAAAGETDGAVVAATGAVEVCAVAEAAVTGAAASTGPLPVSAG
jgi:hypothetical protein